MSEANEQGSFVMELHTLVEEFTADNGDPSVAVVVLVSKGSYRMRTLVSADRPDVFQAVGMLDQMKIELLASIPVNRPLREPFPEPGSQYSPGYEPSDDEERRTPEAH